MQKLWCAQVARKWRKNVFFMSREDFLCKNAQKSTHKIKIFFVAVFQKNKKNMLFCKKIKKNEIIKKEKRGNYGTTLVPKWGFGEQGCPQNRASQINIVSNQVWLSQKQKKILGNHVTFFCCIKNIPSDFLFSKSIVFMY